ncbi:hypothetical protein SNEBB_006335 [Seison nebaliae]|nr:hypothetical protein SNEBB_006335 [Seison nebaliae]
MKQVLNAAKRCKSVIVETSCETFTHINYRLSNKYECPCVVYFKCEDEQETGSFKYRGAVNSLLMNKNYNDFFTHSSGNHGAALSRAAQVHGKNCIVVVPKGTPQSKIDNIRRYGGIIKECEANLKARTEMTTSLVQEKNGIIVSSFNQRTTIFGQGTIGLEILNSIKYIDILVVSISGGGLAAGISIVLNELSPSTVMVIVSPKGKNLREQFILKKRDNNMHFLNTKASGICIKAIGSVPFNILRRVKNELIFLEVEDDEMVDGCQQFWKLTGKKVEMSSGATIKATLDMLPSNLLSSFFSLNRPIHIAAIVCGRNCESQINFE